MDSTERLQYRVVDGRRRPDTPVDDLPPDTAPGDYWIVTTPDGSRPLDVKAYAEDRGFWGRQDRPPESNLTGTVLGVVDPLGHFGMLSLHTVRLEADGTVSVRGGDGSSNSILIKRRADEVYWHGYIEHGVWTGAVEGPDVQEVPV